MHRSVIARVAVVALVAAMHSARAEPGDDAEAARDADASKRDASKRDASNGDPDDASKRDPDDASKDGPAPDARAIARSASLGALFRGPFHSARLFAMPSADVVGAYVLSLSGEGSLLEHPGVLTSAGVLAIGFGDIAQLEYRHTEAIGVTGLDAPVPAVGVQLELPIPAHAWVPAIGLAFRLGVARREQLADLPLDETVTDLYVVGRLRIPGVPWLTLHGGTRISSAVAAPTDPAQARQRTLVLPTAGYELAMTDRARLVGEIALAPQFQWQPELGAPPQIGRGLLGRLGMRWRILPAIILDGSLGYQVDDAAPSQGFDAVVSWDIRLGAEVFVPWGALACRALGVFCDERAGARR